MSSSKLTMIGIYNYDPTLFDDISLPVGINKDVLVPEILRQCGEFEILYPNIEFLKFMISNWSEKHRRTFEKWVEGLAEEFNPLHNYDRHEVYKDIRGSVENIVESKNDKNTSISSETNTENGTSHDENKSNSVSQTDTSSGSETERKVSAYDAATYQPKEKEESSSHGSGNGVSSNNGSNDGRTSSDGSSNSFNSSDGASDGRSDRNLNEVVQHEAHLFGNIGVTTSTQMLEDYLRVERWNIYEHIAELFVDEFCIRIY